MPRPKASPEPGFVASKRRSFRGERRTYPVRDPLSFIDELFGKGKKRRTRLSIF